MAATFVPELLSMNFLMAGMIPAVSTLRARIPSAADPATPAFWFVMSMGLLVGLFTAYPINWWMVKHHLKHGMMTIRPANVSVAEPAHTPHAALTRPATPWPPLPVMALLSFLALAAGVAIAFTWRT